MQRRRFSMLTVRRLRSMCSSKTSTTMCSIRIHCCRSTSVTTLSWCIRQNSRVSATGRPLRSICRVPESDRGNSTCATSRVGCHGASPTSGRSTPIKHICRSYAWLRSTTRAVRHITMRVCNSSLGASTCRHLRGRRCDIPVKRTLEVYGSTYYYHAEAGCGDRLLPVHVVESFENKGGDLGIPLPAGQMRIYQRDSLAKHSISLRTGARLIFGS